MRAYAALALIWGLSFLFIMIGLESVSPIGVAVGRLVIGAITLLILARVMHLELPREPVVLGHLFALALMLNSIPGVLFSYAETYVSSIVAAILNATTPLFGLLATLTLFREQKASRAAQIGLAVGFAGVLVVLGVWRGVGAATWQGIGLCIAAVTLYGVSFPYGRRYLAPRGLSPIAAAAAQVSFGALQTLPLLTIAGLPSDVSLRSSLAILALGALGSGIAYALNLSIVQQAGALTASTVTFWTPFVAAVAGVLVLHEQLRWNEPVGAIIVLGGVLIAQGRLRVVAARLR